MLGLTLSSFSDALPHIEMKNLTIFNGYIRLSH